MKQKSRRGMLLLMASLSPALLTSSTVGNASAPAASQWSSAGQERDLSGSGWRVWLDRDAKWQDDELYLSPEPARLPVHPPTCGWNSLDKAAGQPCSVPASIEEIFSGGVNTWTYHGVSWFSRTFTVPANWRSKRIFLTIEKARLRVEVYLNQKLAGCDIVAETPLSFDLTGLVQAGRANHLAIRITNPGGSRGWEDIRLVQWGSHRLPPSHDFGGLGGDLRLAARDPVYADSLFVKNLLPANDKSVELRVAVRNTTASPILARLTARILPVAGGPAIRSVSWDAAVPAQDIVTTANAIRVPQAQLWDIDHPVLYRCQLTLSAPGISDQITETFGFRTFEIRQSGDRQFFYLNSQRVRLRSAIDWGYYAGTGFFATPEMARKSVEAARAIGHNAISFHRRIGEALVMQQADARGLYLSEEPGGFRMDDGTFAGQIMEEKCRRMALRDRNHPSLLIYNLCNEDNTWNPLRERVMRMITRLDGTRLVVNSSGLDWGASFNHIRPYEAAIRSDFTDNHTVKSAATFQEPDLGSHADVYPGRVLYWGEVRCYTGPSNWYAVAAMQRSLPDHWPGYDLNVYQPLHDQIAGIFATCDLGRIGSGSIKTPADVSRQAGRGLMYTDGRLGQTLLQNDSASGYAINGWSGGPQAVDDWTAWDSAICDEGRNLKGPAADFAYWTRPLQVAIQRKNGKYFAPGETAQFTIHLINEGKLPAGDCVLKLSVTDGAGSRTAFARAIPVKVEGGDRYAQDLGDLEVPLDASWRGGYVTIRGMLSRGNRAAADGAEQVLLQNRPSFRADLAGLTCAVSNWPAAERALSDAGVQSQVFAPGQADARCILAGQVPADPAVLNGMLRQVRDQGCLLITRFDKSWADLLYREGVLSQAVTQWGGEQTGNWNGNGWGYLDHFIGDQAVPSGKTISTNGWEAPGNPAGFYPFASRYRHGAYGLHLERISPLVVPAGVQNDAGRRPSGVLVLLGTIDYGKGKILLDATYPVDDNNPLSDLLFYTMISLGCRGQW